MSAQLIAFFFARRSGMLVIGGEIVVTEADDVLAAAGSIDGATPPPVTGIVGTAAITEAADTAQITGFVTPPSTLPPGACPIWSPVAEPVSAAWTPVEECA